MRPIGLFVAVVAAVAFALAGVAQAQLAAAIDEQGRVVVSEWYLSLTSADKTELKQEDRQAAEAQSRDVHHQGRTVSDNHESTIARPSSKHRFVATPARNAAAFHQQERKTVQ